MGNLVRFDCAIKRLLRNKANFVILERFLHYWRISEGEYEAASLSLPIAWLKSCSIAVAELEAQPFRIVEFNQ